MKENILALEYIEDVVIYQDIKNKKAIIKLVINKFVPRSSINNKIKELAKKCHINEVELTVSSHLDYTPTGKIRLSN